MNVDSDLGSILVDGFRKSARIKHRAMAHIVQVQEEKGLCTMRKLYPDRTVLAMTKSERLKATLVARGNEMDASLYENRSSPTTSTEHVMMLLAITANEKRNIRVLDIGNAFLEADMKDVEDVYVLFDVTTSRF